jgi:hypothetical protein
MKRVFLIAFGLLLIFGLLASVTVAQRMTPVRLAPLSDGSPTLIHIPPTAQPGGQGAHPGDEDGDGIPDGIDQCPNDGGPSSNQGCPPGTGAAVATAVVLPTLPLSGDCVLATSTSDRVNIRVQPSSDAEIVAGLDPQTVYPVNGKHTDGNSVWYRLADGWVAGRVVRLGGDCSLPPEVTLHVTGTGGLQVTLVPISCDITELINAIKNASSGATIALAPGCIYTLTQTYAGTHYGLPNIGITLSIIGNGATIRRRETAATPEFPIFHMNNNSKLTLSDLTLRYGVGWQDSSLGCDPCSGGAIFNLGGSLTLNRVTVSTDTGTGIGSFGAASSMTVTDSTFDHDSAHVGFNQYRPCGGAIENAGILTVSGSTFSYNSIAAGVNNGVDNGDGGGALCNRVGGTLTLTNSTFLDNLVSALYSPGSTQGMAKGGAIENDGTMTVSGSTFSRNLAEDGGAIYNTGKATVSNSTFSGNGQGQGSAISNIGVLGLTNSTVSANLLHAASGNAIHNGSINGSTFVLGSSIVSGNQGGDLDGPIISLGYNVIGSTSGATIVNSPTNDLSGAAASPLNLAALASNGGSTQTMALNAGSVAIGAGNCATLPQAPPVSTDQRGDSRKPICDSGAYEYLRALAS